MSKLAIDTKSLQQYIEKNPGFVPTLMGALQSGLQPADSRPAMAPAAVARAAVAPAAVAPAAVVPTEQAVAEQPSDYVSKVLEERMSSMIDNAIL